jgi:hypothetical protein
MSITHMKKSLLIFISSLPLIMANAQQIIPLYGDTIPNSRPGKWVGLHNTTTKDQWFDRLQNWLAENGLLKK